MKRRREPERHDTRMAVVVVTGASGFLAQHLIARLQSSDVDVSELRLFDRRPFHQFLGILPGLTSHRFPTANPNENDRGRSLL